MSTATLPLSPLTLTTDNQIRHIGFSVSLGVYRPMQPARPGDPLWTVTYVGVQFVARRGGGATEVTVSLEGHDIGYGARKRSAKYTGDPTTWPLPAREALQAAQSTVDGAAPC